MSIKMKGGFDVGLSSFVEVELPDPCGIGVPYHQAFPLPPDQLAGRGAYQEEEEGRGNIA